MSGVQTSIRLWKPLDSEFTDEDRLAIFVSLQKTPEDEVFFEYVDEYLDEIPGHSMIGTVINE